MSQGTALPKGHQAWQMNEVNALIWPNKLGIGVMNPVDYAKTAKISLDFKVIKKPAVCVQPCARVDRAHQADPLTLGVHPSSPPEAVGSSAKASYRADLAKKAVANLREQGYDVNGKRFKKAVVTLEAGGK